MEKKGKSGTASVPGGGAVSDQGEEFWEVSQSVCRTLCRASSTSEKQDGGLVLRIVTDVRVWKSIAQR